MIVGPMMSSADDEGWERTRPWTGNGEKDLRIFEDSVRRLRTAESMRFFSVRGKDWEMLLMLSEEC